jgi:hypothetical protein
LIKKFKIINFRFKISQKFNETSLRPEDLNVVPCGILDSYLRSMFKIRTRQDKEFWLLDYSFLSILDSNFTYMDFDDNIYVYKIQEDRVNIWETYKIHESKATVEVLNYGFWSPKEGLVLDQTNKYERRSNLKVKYTISK